MLPTPNELVVFYQPIYSLRDHTVVSVEALVRGRSPNGHLVGAADMLALAQSPEDQHALDLAVLRQACTDARALLAEHRPAGLHALNVNLTPSSLVRPGLDDEVLGIILDTGLPPYHLRLEVPETAALADLAKATGALRRISSMGVALTLDDVGIEAIGLRHLRSLTIDGIKIDRSIIRRMLSGASDLALVRLLVDLCAGLEIRLTAEGVEQCEQLEVARSLGVLAVQGWHVSRPMPLDRLQQFLRGGMSPACRGCFARLDQSADEPADEAAGEPAHRPGQRAAVPSE